MYILHGRSSMFLFGWWFQLHICIYYIFNHVLYNDPQWRAYSPGGLEMVAAWNETSAAGLKNGWTWGALGFQPFTLHKYWHMRIFQWFFLVNVFLGFATFNASGLTLGKTYYEVNHAEMNLLQLNWRLSLPAKGKNDSLQHWSPVNPCLNGFLMRQKQHMYYGQIWSFFWVKSKIRWRSNINILQGRFLGFKLFLVQACLNGLKTKTLCFSEWNPLKSPGCIASWCGSWRPATVRSLACRTWGRPAGINIHQFLGFGPWKEWENHVEVW